MKLRDQYFFISLNSIEKRWKG